ncbi:ImmA/IrrE family metallo-endopeptidase [Acidicapsa acidisoli]|uniref:ImmA/IrrE family metallo-endopeptidase n=1 Tax=Acidicapsa acidisoli TaxID=1615681 RepID=UPI0021DF78E5|nr:ImmA/IrrE family metallo-endopeptidase [Acidicapsa acidisoli]
MSLRRGFKASANRLSLRLRRGQDCLPHAPIDLEIIAARLEIEIAPLSAFAEESPEAVQQLSIIDSEAFSATTIRFDTGKRIIIHNDSHHPLRQRSNLSHEISHILLGHPFTYPIDSTGCRNHDRDLEDEANWLGPAILISDEAALHIVRQGMDEQSASTHYGVSLPVLRMRINGSGARIRHSRSRYSN